MRKDVAYGPRLKNYCTWYIVLRGHLLELPSLALRFLDIPIDGLWFIANLKSGASLLITKPVFENGHVHSKLLAGKTWKSYHSAGTSVSSSTHLLV